MSRPLPLVVLAAALLGLAGCASQTPPAAAPASGDAAARQALTLPARWELTELMGQPAAAGAGQVPWIRFEAEGSRVHGYSGCNRFSGTYELAPGKRIRFSKMAATLMACAESNVETEFLGVLDGTDSFYVGGETLELHRARMAPLARFRAAENPKQ